MPAQAVTSAVLTPSFSPNRLGARGALTFSIRYEGGEPVVPWAKGPLLFVPSPLRRLAVHFPAGMGLDIPNLRGCTIARLHARRGRGCPRPSLIGRGHALTEIHAGSQTLTERIGLSAYIGPLRNGQPTLEILALGYTPLGERVVFGGEVLFDRAPYGEELVIRIPPLPTLPMEPDASTVTFTLTLGVHRGARSKHANTVIVPARCPVGGFPFAAESTYADGFTASALATAPCP